MIFVEYLILYQFSQGGIHESYALILTPFSLSHCVLRRDLPSLPGEIETTQSCAEMGSTLSDPSLSREIETTLSCAETGPTLSDSSPS